MISRIIHMNVVVIDIEESLKFYCDLLGGHIVGGAEKEAVIRRKTESSGVGIGSPSLAFALASSSMILWRQTR